MKIVDSPAIRRTDGSGRGSLCLCTMMSHPYSSLRKKPEGTSEVPGIRTKDKYDPQGKQSSLPIPPNTV